MTIRVIVGGQFGSEAKGSVCGHLARQAWQSGRALVAVRVAGPNAGHTVYDAKGQEWKFRHLPVAAVVHPQATLILAAGSEIDTQVLDAEVAACEKAGFSIRDRLWIDAQATLIDDTHKHQETSGPGDSTGGLVERIGSTGKGIGAARADRIMRRAHLFKDWDSHGVSGYYQTDTATLINGYADQGREIHIEGTQGYGLGLHAGYYPFCTSSDCRVQDFLAMAGVRHGYEIEPWVVLRTYPIRVAGNSGPLRQEMTWDQMALALGHPDWLKPERTTVTNKIRRIGCFDYDDTRKALAANGVKCRVALTFLDYIFPELHNEPVLTDEAANWLDQFEQRLGTRISLIGTGPNTIFER